MGVKRKIKDINLIVVHCSATPNGRPTTVEDIDGWHNARGFSRNMSISPNCQPHLRHIGYHYVIYTTGDVHKGRSLVESGAHVAGHNTNSIGICLVGTDRFSPSQWASLRGLICLLADILCGGLDPTEDRFSVARRALDDAHIDVCGHGDLVEDKSKNTGNRILLALKRLRDAAIKIRGHRDMSKKMCPGFNVKGWLDRGMQPHEDMVLD